PYLRTQTGTTAVYCNQWQDATFLQALRKRLQEIVPKPSVASQGVPLTLDEMVFQSPGRVYLLLDQFEEYLFYHTEPDQAQEFDAALARIVNAEDVKVQVLIGIREDGLSRFDRRFGIRIPDLLANTLALAPLTPAQASDAIRKPLE